jgi:hypothetical protein
MSSSEETVKKDRPSPSAVDVITSFGQQIHYIAYLFKLRFPKCQATKGVYHKIDTALKEYKAAVQNGLVNPDGSRKGEGAQFALVAMMSVWMLKMRKYKDIVAKQDVTAIEKVAEVGFLTSINIKQKYPKLSLKDHQCMWRVVKEATEIGLLQDTAASKGAFGKIAKAAQHISLLFEKQSLQDDPFGGILEKIPTIMHDEELREIIATISQDEESMSQVFDILELQINSPIAPSMRTMMTTVLQTAATMLANEQFQAVSSQVLASLPGLWSEGTKMFQGFLQENPAMNQMAASLLQNETVKSMLVPSGEASDPQFNNLLASAIHSLAPHAATAPSSSSSSSLKDNTSN